MNNLFNIFLQPFSYDFMLRGLAASVIVGVVCAVVGVYVVLRGMAFFGDALAHAVLPGVALGYLLSGGSRDTLFWWALGAAVLVALAVGRISKHAEIREDTAIGILFASMFALGIALISTVRSYSVDLSHFLFGNVLGVSTRDLVLTSVFGGVVLLTIFLFYKEFLVLSFDPVLAATLRLPSGLLNNILLVLMALTVSVAMQTVGVALMVAMLVTPAATASLLTRRLWQGMLVSAAIGAFSAVTGLYLSYYFNIVSGSAIVLTATAIFLLVFLFQPRRGLVWKKR
ncbi:MAG: metal ABC transporter permease [Chloroflexi bacterium]|nr:metal ABC transporter permease [Chloroflexota bacterium]